MPKHRHRGPFETSMLNLRMDSTLQQFLQEADRLINEAAAAYTDYQSNGRTYAGAQQLWLINDKLYNSLLAGKLIVPSSLLADIEALLRHLYAWREKWVAHELALQPKSTDEFVFENTITFPKSAAEKIRRMIQAD